MRVTIQRPRPRCLALGRSERFRPQKCCAAGQGSPEDSQPRSSDADPSRVTVDAGSSQARTGSYSSDPGRSTPASRVETYTKASNTAQLSEQKKIEQLKRQLLMATAGLDRGLSATRRQADDVARVSRALEEAGGRVQLSWVAGGKVRSSMDDMGGVWRLIYSSAFETGNLGGSRPGPQASLVPFSLGPVYQRIDVQSGLLDNIVELLLARPPVPLPLAIESPAVRATLRHSFTVSDERRVRIVYNNTFAEVMSGEEPVEVFGRRVKLEPPAVQRLLPEDFRSASFDTTFLDDTVRVTRGDRSELRIYWKDRDALGDLVDPDVNNTFSSMG